MVFWGWGVPGKHSPPKGFLPKKFGNHCCRLSIFTTWVPGRREMSLVGVELKHLGTTGLKNPLMEQNSFRHVAHRPQCVVWQWIHDIYQNIATVPIIHNGVSHTVWEVWQLWQWRGPQYLHTGIVYYRRSKNSRPTSSKCVLCLSFSYSSFAIWIEILNYSGYFLNLLILSWKMYFYFKCL